MTAGKPRVLIILDDWGINPQNEGNAVRLADIAPTILDIMGIEQPKEMTGMSLIESRRNGRNGRSAETL